MDKAQEEIENMLNDLNSVNDDFVNGYFDDEAMLDNDETIKFDSNEENIEHSTEEIVSENEGLQEHNFSYSDILNKLDSKEEPTKVEIPDDYSDQEDDLEKTNSYSSSFSYNEILNRLDNKQDVDISNSDEILDLIENSSNSDEFFDAIEQDDSND